MTVSYKVQIVVEGDIEIEIDDNDYEEMSIDEIYDTYADTFSEVLADTDINAFDVNDFSIIQEN